MPIFADALDVAHRLAAAGVAVLQVPIVVRIGQQGQDPLDVAPAVRVQALVSRQDLRVVQVGAPDIVRGQRHERAVRLLHGVDEPLLHACHVAGTAEDALARVEPVAHPDLARGQLRQHHDAAHPRGAAGPRPPVRFLIALRGEQHERQIVLPGGLAEPAAVAREAVVRAPDQHPDVDVVERLEDAEVLLLHVGQPAALAEAGQPARGRAVQGDGPARHRPGEALLARQVHRVRAC